MNCHDECITIHTPNKDRKREREIESEKSSTNVEKKLHGNEHTLNEHQLKNDMTRKSLN